jgi:hypothetical protein
MAAAQRCSIEELVPFADVVFVSQSYATARGWTTPGMANNGNSGYLDWLKCSLAAFLVLYRVFEAPENGRFFSVHKQHQPEVSITLHFVLSHKTIFGPAAENNNRPLCTPTLCPLHLLHQRRPLHRHSLWR